MLITGGAGFLGSALAARARSDGLTVDRLGGVDRSCDIGDPDTITAIIAETRPESIVHLAAVFAAAIVHGVRRIIYASSVAAVIWDSLYPSAALWRLVMFVTVHHHHIRRICRCARPNRKSR